MLSDGSPTERVTYWVREVAVEVAAARVAARARLVAVGIHARQDMQVHVRDEPPRARVAPAVRAQPLRQRHEELPARQPGGRVEGGAGRWGGRMSFLCPDCCPPLLAHTLLVRPLHIVLTLPPAERLLPFVRAPSPEVPCNGMVWPKICTGAHARPGARSGEERGRACRRPRRRACWRHTSELAAGRKGGAPAGGLVAVHAATHFGARSGVWGPRLPEGSSPCMLATHFGARSGEEEGAGEDGARLPEGSSPCMLATYLTLGFGSRRPGASATSSAHSSRPWTLRPMVYRRTTSAQRRARSCRRSSCAPPRARSVP